MTKDLAPEVTWKAHNSRQRQGILISVLLALTLLIPQAAAETPRQFADRFYRAHLRWNVRGCPDTREIRKMASHFGIEPLRLFKAVESQRQREHLRIKRQHDGDPNPPLVKPFWSKEGDCLSSVYEGFSSFAVGRPIIRQGRVVVPTSLKYGSFAWTDHLVLDRAGNSWVVGDIQFKDGTFLVSSLTSELAEFETYLRSPIK